MANNVRVWPAGLFFNQVPGSANLTLLDLQVSTSVSGTGGTYAPSTPIIIGGSGLQLTGPFTASDITSGTFTGPVVFASGGDITLQSGCTLTAQSGSAITVNSGAALTVDGSFVIDAAVSPTFDAAKTYERTVDHPPIYSASNWTLQTDAISYVPIYSSATIASGTTEIVWVFRPPTGATVTAVSVFLTPDTGHGGVPTVELAAAKLLRANTGAANTASVADPSGSVGVYETPHELTLSGLSLTFTEGDLLLIRLTPETGANAMTSMKTSQPKVTFTRALLGQE